MEIIANNLQVVNGGANIYFTDEVVPAKGACVQHRDDSGIITLRGLTEQCRARYRISFGGNVAIPTDGTAGPISLAIAIEGEGVPGSAMTVTPTAVNAYFNVHSSIFIDVPRGCCQAISVKNLGSAAINVVNANLIIERVA